jgi:hypothetical protein
MGWKFVGMITVAMAITSKVVCVGVSENYCKLMLGLPIAITNTVAMV